MNKKVHLLSANSNNVNGLEFFVKKAFRQIGWEVLETDYRVMSKELVDTRIKYITDCDFLLCIKGERIKPESIFSCRVPKILWMQDAIQVNQEANFVIQEKSSVFDIVFAFNDADLPFYKQFNENSYFLPLAADPDIHKLIENENKLIDVGFVGSLNNNRINMINYLLDKGMPVQYNYSIDKYSEIVSNTKININIGKISSGFQQRIFEIVSMGGFLLTNRVDGIELLQDKEHLIYYNDFNNLYELICYYIDKPEEMNKIAKKGRDEILNNNTYVHRINSIIDELIIYNNMRWYNE